MATVTRDHVREAARLAKKGEANELDIRYNEHAKAYHVGELPEGVYDSWDNLEQTEAQLFSSMKEMVDNRADLWPEGWNIPDGWQEVKVTPEGTTNRVFLHDNVVFFDGDCWNVGYVTSFESPEGDPGPRGSIPLDATAGDILVTAFNSDGVKFMTDVDGTKLTQVVPAHASTRRLAWGRTGTIEIDNRLLPPEENPVLNDEIPDPFADEDVTPEANTHRPKFEPGDLIFCLEPMLEGLVVRVTEVQVNDDSMPDELICSEVTTGDLNSALGIGTGSVLTVPITEARKIFLKPDSEISPALVESIINFGPMGRARAKHQSKVLHVQGPHGIDSVFVSDDLLLMISSDPDVLGLYYTSVPLGSVEDDAEILFNGGDYLRSDVYRKVYFEEPPQEMVDISNTGKSLLRLSVTREHAKAIRGAFGIHLPDGFSDDEHRSIQANETIDAETKQKAEAEAEEDFQTLVAEHNRREGRRNKKRQKRRQRKQRRRVENRIKDRVLALSVDDRRKIRTLHMMVTTGGQKSEADVVAAGDAYKTAARQYEIAEEEWLVAVVHEFVNDGTQETEAGKKASVKTEAALEAKANAFDRLNTFENQHASFQDRISQYQRWFADLSLGATLTEANKLITDDGKPAF